MAKKKGWKKKMKPACVRLHGRRCRGLCFDGVTDVAGMDSADVF
jgi:hypothetical protein